MDGELKEWETEVTDFLAEIGIEAESRLLRDLRKLADDRYRLRDITKPLGHGLFELTTKYNKMEYRSIYVFYGNDIVILVCFVKKKRKTPKERINLARSRHSILINREVVLRAVTLH